MAYLCCFTDLNNQISFDVTDLLVDNNNKYIEFAKFVSNPYEKAEILRMITVGSLSDAYLMFSLMDGELWTPYNPPVLQRHNAISEATVSEATVSEALISEPVSESLIRESLAFETIEEEPEISDPD